MEKKTPLYEEHLKLEGQMVPYAGFTLPIQYTSITEEHMAVREKAGLFDVSHMGEVMLTGKDALTTVNTLLPNEFSTLKIGKARYSPMLNDNGGIVDDLLVYRLDEEKYLLVVNAANIDKDVKWIGEHLIGDTKMENQSEAWGQVALQGPVSTEVLKAAGVADAHIPTGFFSFIEDADIAGTKALISQTGYTGSFGYEIYCKAEDTPAIWRKLLEAGAPLGLVPAGLGARDTLRIEACLPLYGQEMTDDIDPLEADLGFATKLGKEVDFVGKAALASKPQTRKRVGLKITGRGIVRGESEVFDGDKKIGFTTSGTHMPYLNGAYALALVEATYEIGQTVSVNVRGRMIEAEIVPTPFYSSR